MLYISDVKRRPGRLIIRWLDNIGSHQRTINFRNWKKRLWIDQDGDRSWSKPRPTKDCKANDDADDDVHMYVGTFHRNKKETGKKLKTFINLLNY